VSCICERCGRPNDDCHFKICVWCHLEGADETTKNLTLGGKFYTQEVTNEQVDVKEMDTHDTH